LEGLQIGNVGNAAGITGSWTGARHNQGWSLLTDSNEKLSSQIHYFFVGDPAGGHTDVLANAN